MDALSDVLRAVRLSGSFFFDIRAADPWVAETPDGADIVDAMFPGSDHLICYHAITAGECWACLDGHPPMRLVAGDVVVLPHGNTHVLSSAPGLRRSPEMAVYLHARANKLPVAISMGGDGSASERHSTSLVCGFLGCDTRPYNPLLSALPQIFKVSDAGVGSLASYVQAALTESAQPRMGGEGVLSRLSELMFVDVVRRYLESLPSDQTDWLSGLRDPFVGRALGELHRSPTREWTIELLARSVGLSRSALAERFTEFVGQPPMHYLAQWRMQLAAGELLGGQSVAAVASRVGYESEAAFSRTFKKIVRTPPAQWRRKRLAL